MTLDTLKQLGRSMQVMRMGSVVIAPEVIATLIEIRECDVFTDSVKNVPNSIAVRKNQWCKCVWYSHHSCVVTLVVH